jgi:DNA-directed RNA polymerase sigma subunit (sigma70/sigma32)
VEFADHGPSPLDELAERTLEATLNVLEQLTEDERRALLAGDIRALDNVPQEEMDEYTRTFEELSVEAWISCERTR